MNTEKNFKQYARYYQSIYKDKNYAREADYVHRLLSQFSKSNETLLDLGCGAGEHSRRFVELGYEVQGVDLSSDMIECANLSCQAWPVSIINNATFTVGDIRTCQLGKSFDVVTSLFHVIGYQTNNEDVVAAFKTAYMHLKPGGLFIFDYWHGPGVLTDRPDVRVKRLADDKGQIIRIAEPTMFPRENSVNVEYTIQIIDEDAGGVDQFTENHKVRYFFEPELQSFLSESWGDYEMLVSEEWMTGKDLDFGSWFGVSVIRKPAK